MRIRQPVFYERVYNSSPEADRKWLYDQKVDFITLEKLLKYKGLVEEFEDIGPFNHWNDYSDISDNSISHFHIKHNRNIKKGIIEKIIDNVFTYAQDYDITEIGIYSLNYHNFTKRHELLFKSKELKDLLTQFDIEYITYSNINTFEKTIKIEEDTKISDIKEAIDNFLSLTGFIDNCIKKIKTPDKAIIR